MNICTFFLNLIKYKKFNLKQSLEIDLARGYIRNEHKSIWPLVFELYLLICFYILFIASGAGNRVTYVQLRGSIHLPVKIKTVAG